jgi:formate dehydrogenase subunit delta
VSSDHPDNSTDTLVRMINQISANVNYQPADEAAATVASHLNRFWAPSMRTQLLEFAAGGGAGLDDLSQQALLQVR